LPAVVLPLGFVGFRRRAVFSKLLHLHTLYSHFLLNFSTKQGRFSTFHTAVEKSEYAGISTLVFPHKRGFSRKIKAFSVENHVESVGKLMRGYA